MFSLIINYYQNQSPSSAIRSSVILAAELAKPSDLISEIIVSDGSSSSDTELSKWCHQNDHQYLHQGSATSFAETYNAGVRAAQCKWVILSASDIYTKPENYRSFEQLIKSCPPNQLGCLIPYLTDSAYIPQLAPRRIPKCWRQSSYKIPATMVDMLPELLIKRVITRFIFSLYHSLQYSGSKRL